MLVLVYKTATKNRKVGIHFYDSSFIERIFVHSYQVAICIIKTSPLEFCFLTHAEDPEDGDP